jgi:type II secretory pathway component HofQ
VPWAALAPWSLAASLLAAPAPAGPTPTPKPASPSAKKPAPKAPAIRVPRRPLEPGDRISLDLKDADIRDVIRSFGELARINVVIDPDVKGSVTVRLHDVRWEDALDVILRSNGLGAVSEGNLVRVGSPNRMAGDAPR